MTPKISNNAADYETFLTRQKQVARKLLPVNMLPDYASAVPLYAAVTSVSRRPPSKADVSQECLPITAFPAEQELIFRDVHCVQKEKRCQQNPVRRNVTLLL